ncbi:MAG: hypothetical protein ACRCTE_01015 [Cellulosilyticaceae bacterium]
MFKIKIKWRHIIFFVVLSISLMIYLAIYKLESSTKLSLIDEWIPSAILCFVFAWIGIGIRYTTMIKSRNFKMILLIVIGLIFLGKLITIPFEMTEYTQKESPHGQYTLLVKSTHIGFEEGVSDIYTKENHFLKKYVASIYTVKSSGVIGDNTDLTWLNESQFLVEANKYRGRLVQVIYKVDVENGGSREYQADGIQK